MRQMIVPVMLAALTACGGSSGDPGAGPTTPTSPSSHAGAGELVGTWSVELTLDSIQAPAPGSPWTRLDPPRSVKGTLTIVRSGSESAEPPALRARLDADLTRLLQREMSCYDPGWNPLVATRAGDEWRLWFTPGAADCGWTATVIRDAERLAGGWSEVSFIGPVAGGAIALVRTGP